QLEADLLHGLVLDLADALLGHADDLAHLLERHGLLGRAGLEAEAVLDDRALHAGQIGPVLQDDALDLVGSVALVVGPLGLEEVGLLELRVEIRREALAVLAQLHPLAAERLEDGAAGIRRELEAA